MEKRADSLSNQLETIRGIIDRIDQSKTDKMVRGGANCVPPAPSRWLRSPLTGFALVCLQVIQAYQAGVAALKLSLKEVTVEEAENLVDQIQEVWRPLQTQTHHRQPSCRIEPSWVLAHLCVSLCDSCSCATLRTTSTRPSPAWPLQVRRALTVFNGYQLNDVLPPAVLELRAERCPLIL